MERKFILESALLVLISVVTISVSEQGEKLVQKVVELGVPFAQESFEKVFGSVFGSKRADRSTDVVLVNKSRKNFQIGKKSCDYGTFTSDLVPEPILLSNQANVYGIESNTVSSGVKCTVRYNSGDYFFDVTVDNSLESATTFKQFFSAGLSVYGGLEEQGYNNQLLLIIEDL